MIYAFFFFFASQTIPYWVQPCVHADTGCQPADTELGDWAMQAWAAASSGRLELKKVAEPQQAQFRLYWASAQQGLYGETRPIEVNGKRGAEIFVLPPHPLDDSLLRDTIVYLTCLHETGHALGLPHTAAFEDIMYSFQYGGDIAEYFGRYRRKLKTRDDIRKYSGMSDADRKRFDAVSR